MVAEAEVELALGGGGGGCWLLVVDGLRNGNGGGF